MSFTCNLCSYTFSTKWNLVRHSKRKTSCVSVKNQNCIPNLRNCIPKNEICIPKNEICITTQNNTPNIAINPINLYICMYCNKSYNNRKSKYKHQKLCKNVDKSNKKEENIQNIKEILRKIKNTDKSLIVENDVLKIKKNNNIKSRDTVLNKLPNKLLTKKIVNITNNNITNNNITNNTNSNNTINNNVTININAFGSENLEALTLPTIKRIFSKKYGCLNSALSEIYANIPENNNFYLANKGNSKFMRLYNGKKCIYEKTNKFKTILSDNTMNHLEVLLEDNKENIVKKHREVIEKVIDDYFGGKLTERYDDEVELFIMNHTDDMKEVLTSTLQKLKNK
jgi:hypothetical protein